MDLLSSSVRGGEITSQEARRLEASVARTPTDAESRAVLACFYAVKGQGPSDPRRIKHALWFIEHFPADRFTQVPFVAVEPRMRTAFARAKRLWLRHARTTPSAAILRGAARFFSSSDVPRALRLLARANRASPNDREPIEDMGRLHLGLANDAHGAKRRRHATRALKAFQASMALEPSDRARWYRTKDLARSALYAGELTLAREAAESMLEQASAYDDWNTGNAVHHGHTILGMLALEADDADAAAQHLLAAGATRGSPQLNSFGPDFSLAREVLKRGRRNEVIEYLRRVTSFWGMGAGDPERWSREIERTGRTSFERNHRAVLKRKPRRRARKV